MSLELFARAFEAWENGYRAEPSKFMTAEECASAGVSDLSAQRAAYFSELLASVPVGSDGMSHLIYEPWKHVGQGDIVACVNACAGISTKELLERGLPGCLLDQRAALEQQRNELLQALGHIEKAAKEQGPFTGSSFIQIAEMAEAAIAKLKS